MSTARARSTGTTQDFGASSALLPRYPQTLINEGASTNGSYDRSGAAEAYKPAARPPRAEHARWYKIWWLELVALVFSISCVIANITFLSYLSNKQTAPWHIRGMKITPNAILSISTTLSKSSLLLVISECIGQMKWPYYHKERHPAWHIQVFDHASRGPLGSLHLLWRLHKNTVIASFGAILTILALATEVFTQQVLTYYTLDAPASNLSASIVNTSVFVQPWNNFPDYAVMRPDINGLVDYVLEGKWLQEVQSGIDHSFQDVRFNCPTSNCTWPSFETLSVCTFCEDATPSTMEVSCEDFEVPLRHELDLSTDINPYNASICTYSLDDSSVWTKDTKFWTVWDYASLTGDLTSVPKYGSLLQYNITTAASDQRFVEVGGQQFVRINSFTAMTIGADATSPILEEAKKIMPNVTSCAMAWCVAVRNNTHFEAGSLTDNPTSILPLHTNDSYKQILIAYPDIGVPQYWAGYTDEAPPVFSFSADTPLWNTDTDYLKFAQDYRPDIRYWIDENTVNRFRAVWREWFDGFRISDFQNSLVDLNNGTGNATNYGGPFGFIPGTPGAEEYNERYKAASRIYTARADSRLFLALDATQQEDTSSYSIRTSFLRANSGNLTQTTLNIARSLTNGFRSGMYSGSATGTASLPFIYANVHWYWLIYPAALPVLTAILLALVIVMVHGADSFVWKSSSLALLFHGVRTEDSSADETRSPSSMETLAKTVSVRIDEDERGSILLQPIITLGPTGSKTSGSDC